MGRTRASDGRRLAELFFTKDSNNNGYWKCRCGVKRKKSNSSYANLLSHIRTSHQDYEELLSADGDVSQCQIDRFFLSSTSKSYFGWFDLVINGLLPFSFVENPVARLHFKHPPISLSTLMRHLPRLTELVEAKVAALLPPTFAIVFDGWSTASTHYLSVFASFPSATADNGYNLRLLAFSPMEDETRLGASEHYEFMTFVLSVFNKSWSNVACLIGDNCNTNKALSRAASTPMIGCASHRFNLAVQDILLEDQDIIEKVNAVMLKLKTLTLAAKLFKLSGLRAKTKNTTRWSSVFEMLMRYEELKEHIILLSSDELDDLRLTSAETRRFSILLQRLKDLDSVTKRLQQDSTTLADVRLIFDAVIENFPETSERLKPDATIVQSVTFEAAIVKVQLGYQAALDRQEKASIERFSVQSVHSDNSEDDELSFADRALKRQKRSISGETTSYGDMRFLLPTSNVCERLFSKAGHVLNDRRKGLLPANLECQLFLHMNRDLWSAKDLAKVGSDALVDD